MEGVSSPKEGKPGKPGKRVVRRSKTVKAPKPPKDPKPKKPVQMESTKALAKRAGFNEARLRVVQRLFLMLENPMPSKPNVTFLEEMLTFISHSEFLLGKFLDKLLPTMTPEQNVFNLNRNEQSFNLGALGDPDTRHAAALLEEKFFSARKVVEVHPGGNGANGQ